MTITENDFLWTIFLMWKLDRETLLEHINDLKLPEDKEKEFLRNFKDFIREYKEEEGEFDDYNALFYEYIVEIIRKTNVYSFVEYVYVYANYANSWFTYSNDIDEDVEDEVIEGLTEAREKSNDIFTIQAINFFFKEMWY